MREETIEKLEDQKSADFSYPLNETGDYRDTWRIFRIMSEFVEGYQFLNQFEKEVTVMGSARLDEENKYYKIARALGKELAAHQFTTITGGGPGIMEAANRGAHEGGGESVGLNINLPFEQRINPYVKKSTAFYYFFTRKVMLTAPADAFVFFPGGFGTLDEFFEVVDHIELGKMCHVPIVLVGKEFWQPVVDFLSEKVCSLDAKHMQEMAHWHIVDSTEEAIDIITKNAPVDRACELSPLNFHSGRKMEWRIFRIMSELVEGFEFLTGMVENVTVLGTRSVDFESEYYRSAYYVGRRFGEEGYTVVTGGANGIAEAANKGAMESGAPSVGIGMQVKNKEPMNQYVTKSIMFKFPFTRKLIVSAPSKAFVFFPGGFGTVHQLFETLTLMQTGKMQRVPVILFDSKYWKPVVEFIHTVLDEKMQTISKKDCDLLQIVDDEEEIIHVVNGFRNKKEKRHANSVEDLVRPFHLESDDTSNT